MGRRAKSKKHSITVHREDGSGEEEKIPVKRRGRPTKAHKEEQEEEEAEKIDESKNIKNEAPLETSKKRKKPFLQTEENLEKIKDENGMNGDELTKSVGFRHNGSRRKNKPRRAAEVGVSAYEVCSWLVLRS